MLDGFYCLRFYLSLLLSIQLCPSLSLPISFFYLSLGIQSAWGGVKSKPMHVYVVFFSSPLYERDGTIPVVVLKRERVKSETKKKKENLKKNLRETKLSLYVRLFVYGFKRNFQH